MTQTLKKFWVSWYGYNGTFELRSPWWLTGYCISERLDRLGNPKGDATFCAAVMAPNGALAKSLIRMVHDDQKFARDMEFRFCEEKPDNWSPFHLNRFPRREWMEWSD